jgi:hypothetical protein
LAINTRYGKKKLNILQFFGYMLELNREIFKGNWLKFGNDKTRKTLFVLAILEGKKKKKILFGANWLNLPKEKKKNR